MDILEMAVKDRWRDDARCHATAVAAIVRFGEPKIDEPLSLAWKRTLLHRDILIPDGCENEVQFASPKLYSAKDAERYRFREILKTAPTWLLDFTWIRLDAFVLGFDLPSLSDKRTRGRARFSDGCLWPQLPLGKAADSPRRSSNSEDDEKFWRGVLMCRALEPYMGQPDGFVRFLEPTYVKLAQDGYRFNEIKPKTWRGTPDEMKLFEDTLRTWAKAGYVPKPRLRRSRRPPTVGN